MAEQQNAPRSPLFADNAELKKTKRTSGQKILMFVMIIIIAVMLFVIMAQNSEQTTQNAEQQRAKGMMTDASKLKNELLDAARRQPALPASVPEAEQKAVEPTPKVIVIQPATPPKKQARKLTDAQKESGREYRDFRKNSLSAKSAVDGFKDMQQESDKGDSNVAVPQRTPLMYGGREPYDGEAALAALEAQKTPQQRKLEFLTQQGEGRTPQGYSDQVRTPQLMDMELKAGTVIPGLLLTGVNSDLPGMVIGQVSENVYDSSTGAYLLIPQGARLLGVYDSQITQGQKRVGIVWNRIIYPDGSSLNIGGSPGADMAGYSGIKGKVDHHYSQLLMAGLFTSFFTAAVDIASDNKDDTGSNNQKKSAKDVLVETTGTTIANIGAKLAEKALEIQPTIVVKSGSRFNVLVQQDVVFPEPWIEPTTTVTGF